MTTMLTTREAVKAALDIATTARADTLIDQAIAAASEDVEAELHRRFRPTTTTRYFDWPSRDGRSSYWRLWLNQHEIISVTTLTVGGTTVTGSNYLLRPDDGPPYTRLELALDGTPAAFSSNSETHQRSIAVTGLFGYRNDERTAGTLAEEVDGSETVIDVTNGAAIGIGDTIRIDTERINVTERGWLTTGTTISADLAASVGTRAVAVASGTGINAGELLLIDSEVLRVDTVNGNTITCRRAWDGSTLAAHTSGATVYASRSLTVERGALGTTAAAHTNGTAIAVHVVPSSVRAAAQAIAIATLQADRAGQTAQSGTEAAGRDATGTGAGAALARAYRTHGRKGRTR